MVVDTVKSGLAQLIGKVARCGRPILRFTPLRNHKIYLDGSRVEALLNYYSAVANDLHGCNQLIVVIKPSIYSNDICHVIRQALDKLIASGKDQIVSCIYVIGEAPKSAPKKFGSLLRPKKRRSEQHKCRCSCLLCPILAPHTVVLTESELAIAGAGPGWQEPPEQYLNGWVQVRNIVERLEKGCQATLADLSRSGRFMDECRNTINLLLCPYVDPVLADLERAPVFIQARRSAMNCMQQVISAVNAAKLGPANAHAEEDHDDDTDLNFSSFSCDESTATPNQDNAKAFVRLMRLYKQLDPLPLVECASVLRDMATVHAWIDHMEDMEDRNCTRLLLYRCRDMMRTSMSLSSSQASNLSS